jgi:glutaredoxin
MAIIIYGTSWCGDCNWVRKFFDTHNIGYKWVDIDLDEDGEEFVYSTNHGMRSVPTIYFEDGSILVEPTDSELNQTLPTILYSI